MPLIPHPQGWTSADIAFITVTGAILAAAIAFCGAIFAASINAWSARRIARDTARRDLKAKSFEPYVAKINDRIQTCHRAMMIGSQLTSMAESANAASESNEDWPEENIVKLLELANELVFLTKQMHKQHGADYDTVMLAHDDQELIDSHALFMTSISGFILRAGELELRAVKQEELKELQQLIWVATINGAAVLAALQEVIMGRTWWSRTKYKIRRRLGWTTTTI
jgi:hypothetical protein